MRGFLLVSGGPVEPGQPAGMRRGPDRSLVGASSCGYSWSSSAARQARSAKRAAWGWAPWEG